MSSLFGQQLKALRDLVDAMVESLLQCSDEDLARPLELNYEGRPFRTNLRSATRYTIEEYRVHEGQIAGNQYLTESLRVAKSSEEVDAFSPYDRKEAAWLAAELYLAASTLIARLLGYPDQLVAQHPKDDEWSIREIIDHLIHLEKSGEWSLRQLVTKAKGRRE